MGFSDGKDFSSRCSWKEEKKEEMEDSFPWPAHWFHLHRPSWNPDWKISEDGYNSMQQRERHADLCLHRKSEALWALPDLSLEDPTPDDPNYMLATDPRLPENRFSYGSGRFTVPGCRLQIPTPSRYTESVFLIIARELEMPDQGAFWLEYLHYLNTYVYKVSINESFLSPATLEPSIGKIWKIFLEEKYQMSPYMYFAPLREDLIRKGALPGTAFPWVMRQTRNLPEPQE